MVDGIIFDLDGTLWDSTDVGAVAWSEAARQEGYSMQITAEKLKSLYGLPTELITLKLFPEASETVRMNIMSQSNQLQNKKLAKNGATLYSGVRETLFQLKEKYNLYIVSNCLEGYIPAFIQGHQLEGIFSDYEHPGRTSLSKGDNIKLVMERNNLKNTFYVGDTLGDETAAKEAQLPFVYASYGFGESQNYEYELNSFKEIITLPLLE